MTSWKNRSKRANLWKEVSNQLNKDGLALSGGQQRLCIARVLAVQPDVLLMDEPCSAIDPTRPSLSVEDLMAELAPEMTIIIVTHSMQQAARISDYTAFFLQEVAGEPATLIEYGQPTRSSPVRWTRGRKTISPAALLIGATSPKPIGSGPVRIHCAGGMTTQLIGSEPCANCFPVSSSRPVTRC